LPAAETTLGATLNRLQCRDATLALIDNLHALIAVLIERAEQFADVVMAGYTHMQPAQPATYGFYLLGIADAFMRDGDRLDDLWAARQPQPAGRGGDDRHQLPDRP
jgi:argininosuccinate lyase